MLLYTTSENTNHWIEDTQFGDVIDRLTSYNGILRPEICTERLSMVPRTTSEGGPYDRVTVQRTRRHRHGNKSWLQKPVVYIVGLFLACILGIIYILGKSSGHKKREFEDGGEGGYGSGRNERRTGNNYIGSQGDMERDDSRTEETVPVGAAGGETRTTNDTGDSDDAEEYVAVRVCLLDA